MHVHRKYQVMPITLITVIVFLCISCGTNTQPSVQGPVQDTAVSKCIVDLPIPSAHSVHTLKALGSSSGLEQQIYY